MSEPLHELVVIDDMFITQALQDPRYTSAFPFLSYIAHSQPPARRCCRDKGRSRSVDFNSVKQSFANLPESEKVRLKELAHARKIRIIFRNTSGNVVQLTF